ncbi:Histone-lysine N-methyltransferase PRDM9 [Aphelenchoides bicaudatus]|nr:Histone-lysine N-methyltransferase PRDM9 [Aphelenchoides bicaudatus]
MKLDHLLEQVQAGDIQIKQEVEDESTQDRNVEQQEIAQISPETTNNGLMAIGGCRSCAKTFVDRVQFIHHITDHFPSIFYSFDSPSHEPTILEQLASFLTTVKQRDPNRQKTLSFQCEQCQIRCNNLYLLKEHRRFHAKICNICGEQFDTVFDLNVHVGIHCGNPYACKDCGQSFISRKALAEHNRIHRLILENEISPEPNLIEHQGNKRQSAQKQPDATSSSKSNEDKPISLLSSNLYFNGLAKNITRRRRARIPRLKTPATINNVDISKESKQ